MNPIREPRSAGPLRYNELVEAPPALPGRSIGPEAPNMKENARNLGFFELTNFPIAQAYQSMLERGIIIPAPATSLHAKFSSSGESNFDLEGVKTRTPSDPPPPIPGRSICTTDDCIRRLFEFSCILKGNCSRSRIIRAYKLSHSATISKACWKGGIIMPAPRTPPCAQNLAVQVKVTLTSRKFLFESELFTKPFSSALELCSSIKFRSF